MRHRDSVAQASTTHGTVSFNSVSDAAPFVMNSAVRMQIAVDAQQKAKSQAAIDALTTNPDIDPVTVSIVAAVIAGVGVSVAVAGVAASATSAGVGVANLSMQNSAAGTGALEVNVKNDMATPVVYYEYETHNCSTASSIGPLLPGSSGSIDVLNNEKFSNDDLNSIIMTFLIGGGVTSVNNEPVLLDTVTVGVEFQFNNGNWVPWIMIDGSSWKGNSADGLSLLSFEPNEGERILPFAVAAMQSQRNTSSVDVLFLPNSAALKA